MLLTLGLSPFENLGSYQASEGFKLLLFQRFFCLGDAPPFAAHHAYDQPMLSTSTHYITESTISASVVTLKESRFRFFSNKHRTEKSKVVRLSSKLPSLCP